MPVGPYKTFAECVADQQRRGQSEEEARRICGAMERDAKQSEPDFRKSNQGRST